MPAEHDRRNTPATGQMQLMMPIMNPVRGRLLLAEKGCVACHAVNGVGGGDAPPLNASAMGRMMNPFDFAANMWRGAEAMMYARLALAEERQTRAALGAVYDAYAERVPAFIPRLGRLRAGPMPGDSPGDTSGNV